jgi:hypothetical protein
LYSLTFDFCVGEEDVVAFAGGLKLKARRKIIK